MVSDSVGIVKLECGGDALEGEVVCGLGVGFCVVLGDCGNEAKGVEAKAAVSFEGKGVRL